MRRKGEGKTRGGKGRESSVARAAAQYPERKNNRWFPIPIFFIPFLFFSFFGSAVFYVPHFMFVCSAMRYSLLLYPRILDGRFFPLPFLCSILPSVSPFLRENCCSYDPIQFSAPSSPPDIKGPFPDLDRPTLLFKKHFGLGEARPAIIRSPISPLFLQKRGA